MFTCISLTSQIVAHCSQEFRANFRADTNNDFEGIKDVWFEEQRPHNYAGVYSLPSGYPSLRVCTLLLLHASFNFHNLWLVWF